MRGIKSFIVFSIAVILFNACQENKTKDGYTMVSEGVWYKLITIGGDRPKAVKGDHVLLRAKYLCCKDSVFWDSDYDSGESYLIDYDVNLIENQFWHFILENFGEGDSIQLKVSTHDFFKDVFSREAPEFSKKDTFIKAEILIQKILSPEKFDIFLSDSTFRREAASWKQKILIDEFVKKSMRHPVRLDSLLFYEKVVNTKDVSVQNGMSVSVSYVGSLLNGRVVDRTDPRKPLQYVYGEKEQLIPGLELALYHMKRGESAKIIIPSHLGFGNEKGGRFPPFTPMVYELKLIDIK